jgi:putative restriction endonuclease
VSSDVAPCTIHHGAYDQDLMGVSPDYDVRVSPRLLEDDDGPMLDLLKTFRPAADLRPAPSGVEPGTLGVALRAIP